METILGLLMLWVIYFCTKEMIKNANQTTLKEHGVEMFSFGVMATLLAATAFALYAHYLCQGDPFRKIVLYAIAATLVIGVIIRNFLHFGLQSAFTATLGMLFVVPYLCVALLFFLIGCLFGGSGNSSTRPEPEPEPDYEAMAAEEQRRWHESDVNNKAGPNYDPWPRKD